MPINATQARQQQGAHHRKHHGLAAPSHPAACQRRFGRPAVRLNVEGIRNQLAFALMMGSALPASARLALGPCSLPPAPAPGSAAGGGWLPGTQALQAGFPMETPAAATAISPAQAPLLAMAPSGIANAVSDAALAGCLRSPRQCGTALWTAAGVTAFWAGAAAAGYLLHRPAVPAAAPAPLPTDLAATSHYTLDPARLLRPVRFNASELDMTLSPCDSLGAHVNRRWEQSSALQPSRTQFGTLDHLRSIALLQCQQLAEQMAAQPAPDPPAKVIGDLWATGMDEAGIEVAGRRPLQPLLDRIEAIGDLPSLVAHLFDSSARGSNPLFEFSVLPDQLDPSVNTAYLAQSGLGLPDSTWYDDPEKQHILDAYRAHVSATLVLSGMPPEAAGRSSHDIVSLERALAAASLPFAVYAADPGAYHNPVSPAEAHTLTPAIDWQQFFRAQGVEPPATFSLGMPDFFQRVDALLEGVPRAAWKAYLRFHATDSAAPCLSSAFVDQHDAFHGGVLKGRRSRVPRFARVMGILQQHAGDALGPAYAEVAFPPSTRRAAEEITAQMTAALRRRLQQCEWMDDSSRARALDKAATLQIDLGHPRTWPTWDHVGTSRSSFLANVQAVRAHAQRRNVAQLGEPVDATHWKLTPQTVDAYQDVSLNRIVIPAALLQPPLFDPAADAPLNYGALGAIIGHEMGHAFDSVGTHFDAEGQENDWLSAQSRQQLGTLAARVKAQYAAYVRDGRALDGELTLDENLADVGGLSLAMDAMLHATAGTPDAMIDGLTRQQRLLVSYALMCRTITTKERAEAQRATDSHAPGQVRADMAPSNLRDFARVFNCSEGAPMARPPGEQVRFL